LEPEPPVSPVRILIVDDHPLIRQIIRLGCEGRPDLEIVGEAADGHQALAMARELQPDVVVLDLVIPGMDGFEVASRLRANGSAARILIVSAHGERGIVFEALRLGAAGFLEKTASVDEIVAAVVAVAGGTEVFSVEHERSAQARLGELARAARSAARAAATLTARERQVLQLIVEGLTSRQVATRLQLSERTVETHIANLYRKLDVRTRVQALHRAASLGLVDLG
jgi:DNA-binding NarL/FixJ family response regulator